MSVSSDSPDPLERFRVLPLLVRELGFEQQRCHAQHTVHRCADLVAHVGEELALRDGRGLGLRARSLERDLQLLVRGHVHRGAQDAPGLAIGELGLSIGTVPPSRPILEHPLALVADGDPLHEGALVRRLHLRAIVRVEQAIELIERHRQRGIGGHAGEKAHPFGHPDLAGADVHLPETEGADLFGHAHVDHAVAQPIEHLALAGDVEDGPGRTNVLASDHYGPALGPKPVLTAIGPDNAILAVKGLAGARAEPGDVERGAVIGMDARDRRVRGQRHALARQPEQHGRTGRKRQRIGEDVDLPDPKARGIFSQRELRRLVGQVLQELLRGRRHARLRPRASQKDERPSPADNRCEHRRREEADRAGHLG